MGAVPRLLAPILNAMGAEPIYWSRSPKPDALDLWLQLPELLATSDIVSLHLPLTPETAGLDVFATEPLPADHPLLALPDVTSTPHLAWLTGETLGRSLDVAVDNVRHLAAGDPSLFHVV